MKTINRMKPLPHEGLPGTQVLQMDKVAVRDQHQKVLVMCDADATIPLHTHSVDATMYIVAGEGWVLSSDKSADGRFVTPGDIVFFTKDIPHGFKASDKGLTFVSENGGICDTNGDWDIDFNQNN